jgi:hypothetical protein
MVANFCGMLWQFKSAFGRNLNVVDSKIDSMDARFGFCAKHSLSENCIPLWNGICYLDDFIVLVANSLKALKVQHAALQADSHDNCATASSHLDDVVLVDKGFSLRLFFK